MTPSARAGTPTMFALIATWVFALLPANLVPSIIEKLVYELGVDVTIAGFVATGMTLANAAAVLGSRRAVQRGNRVRIARIGLLVMVLAFCTGAALPTAGIIFAALLIGGAGSGLVISAATAAVSATPNPDRATALVMIVNRIVVTLTFLTIPLVGGGIRELFLILALPGAISYIGAHWLPRTPEATGLVSVVGTAASAATAGDALHAPDTAASRLKSGSPADFTNRDVSVRARRLRRLGWTLAIAFGAWSVTDDGVYGLVGVLVGESNMAVGDSYVPMLFALSIFCGLLGALAAPVMHKYWGRTPTLVGVLTLSAIAKLGLMTLTNPVIYATSSAVWGFAFGAMLPLIFGLAASLSRDGSISVLVNGVYILGVALGPLVSTQLFDRFGAITLACVMTVLAFSTAALMIYASRFAERQHEDRGSDLTANESDPVSSTQIGTQA